MTQDEEREVERLHAFGDHEYCGITCEEFMPSQELTTALLYWAIPGSASMLAELLRRERERTLRDAADFLESPRLSDGMYAEEYGTALRQWADETKGEA